MTMMSFTVLPFYLFTFKSLFTFKKSPLSEPVTQCYKGLMALVGHSGG